MPCQSRGISNLQLNLNDWKFRKDQNDLDCWQWLKHRKIHFLVFWSKKWIFFFVLGMGTLDLTVGGFFVIIFYYTCRKPFCLLWYNLTKLWNLDLCGAEHACIWAVDWTAKEGHHANSKVDLTAGMLQNVQFWPFMMTRWNCNYSLLLWGLQFNPKGEISYHP
jgi:hypothetical protein